MTMYMLKMKADILENITSFNGTQNQIVIRRTWNAESLNTHCPCKLFNKAAQNTEHHAVRTTKHATLAKPPPATQNSAVQNLIIPAQWPPKKSQTWAESLYMDGDHRHRRRTKCHCQKRARPRARCLPQLTRRKNTAAPNTVITQTMLLAAADQIRS